MKKGYKHSMTYHDEWKKNHGALGFKMHNDYLFRMLMQRDEKTLKAIIASVMEIDIRKISEVIVTNPIVPGEAIDDLEVHLDINVSIVTEDNLLQQINVEMQAYIDPNWIDRSVFYVCRMFNDLNKGKKYNETIPVWQIAFCDFTLFKNEPAFVSIFKFINTKKLCQVYTDKITITNINLKAIEKAEKKHVDSGLVKWAKLFKAESWEDLMKLAKEDDAMDYAISSVWQLTEDQRIREQMRRREENEREWNYREELLQNALQEAVRSKEEAKQAQKEVDTLKEENEKLRKKLALLEKNAISDE